MKRALVLFAALAGSAAFAAPASASVGAPPTSCAAIAAANPSAPDGDYTIYPNGETFSVYCADMASAPTEYLDVRTTDSNGNTANYSTDMDSWYDTLTTDFTKVRLDPSTLQVKIGDTRFSSTSGWVNYNGNTLPQSYGVASACGWTTGSANVDLTGTPFYVNDQFVPQGWGQYGSATFSSNNQVVDITGGGDCGDNEPSNHTYLQLGYNGTTYSAPPVITPTVTGTMGSNGSYTGPVKVTWASDQPVIDSEGCGEQDLSVATTGTTFTCTLSGPGGVSSQSVTIKLDSPSALGSLVGEYSTSPGVTSGLGSKLDAIGQAANANAKAGSVKAFINQVNAQTGKALTADQAATLIALVTQL